MTPTNILIDTDVGDDVDDVLAIAFALLRPELRVRAITTVSYDTDKRCHILARLLQIMGLAEVPFAPGMQWPIHPLTSERRAGLNDLSSGYILNQYPFASPQEGLPQAREDAITLMAQTVEAHAGDIALVAIGPLTNIATFLRRYPELAPKIRHIALMGGEMAETRREHNLCWDATATHIVFNSGVPLFVGTWSVTRQFVLSPEDCETIKNIGTPLCVALSACIDLWWPHKAHKPGPVMYDIAPILWSYDQSYYPTELMPVRIEMADETTAGATLRGGDGPNIQVSTAMLAPQVRQLYLDTLTS